MSKPWPDEGTINCEELLRAVKKLAWQMITWENVGKGKDLSYDGYDFGSRTKGTGPDPEDLITAAGQEHGKDQGRDPVDTLLLIAYQLGVEQGTRIRDEEMVQSAETVMMLMNSPNSPVGNVFRRALDKVKDLKYG
jgi:hypothetical protein